jgi:hypothetical protein
MRANKQRKEIMSNDDLYTISLSNDRASHGCFDISISYIHRQLAFDLSQVRINPRLDLQSWKNGGFQVGSLTNLNSV